MLIGFLEENIAKDGIRKKLEKDYLALSLRGHIQYIRHRIARSPDRGTMPLYDTMEKEKSSRMMTLQ